MPKGPGVALLAAAAVGIWAIFKNRPKPSQPMPPATPTPNDWLDQLNEELRAAGVTDFTAEELTELRKVQAPYVRPYYAQPPAELWPNLVEAGRLAQRVRDLYGGPLRAYNGYRPQWYNDAVGGAPNSWHVQAGAVDLTPVSPVTSDKVAKLHDAAQQAIDELGPSVGGLGIYSTAAHVDIGPKRSWNG